MVSGLTDDEERGQGDINSKWVVDKGVVYDVAEFELLSTLGMGEEEGEQSGSATCPTESRTVTGERGKLDRGGEEQMNMCRTNL